ncbi:MAG: dihydrofolate reductase [Myxococcota bacterium]
MPFDPRREPLALIVAVGRGGIIGQSGGRFGLPWHLPEDLRRFRRLTTGHAVLMGRTTHEAIGRPLPKRRNIVLTRDPGRAFPGAERAGSLAEALSMARTTDAHPFVLGGATVYAEALPFATHLHLTEVDRPTEGDVRFPSFDPAEWDEVTREAAETEGVTFRELRRRAAGF